jgi:hypothetical protein
VAQGCVNIRKNKMHYKVIWPNDGTRIFNDSRFETWDGKVVDATPGLKWAVGKSYVNTVENIHNQGGVVELVQGTVNFDALATLVKLGTKPRSTESYTSGVLIRRTWGVEDPKDGGPESLLN